MAFVGSFHHHHQILCDLVSTRYHGQHQSLLSLFFCRHFALRSGRYSSPRRNIYISVRPGMEQGILCQLATLLGSSVRSRRHCSHLRGSAISFVVRLEVKENSILRFRVWAGCFSMTSARLAHGARRDLKPNSYAAIESYCAGASTEAAATVGRWHVQH